MTNLASDDACYKKARGLAGVELPTDDTGSSADMTIIGRIWRHGFAEIQYGRPFPMSMQVQCLAGPHGPPRFGSRCLPHVKTQYDRNFTKPDGEAWIT